MATENEAPRDGVELEFKRLRYQADQLDEVGMRGAAENIREAADFLELKIFAASRPQPAYDRERIADMLEGYAKTTAMYEPYGVAGQVRMLRAADNADAASARTVSRPQPAAGEVAFPEPIVEICERDDVGAILEWKDGSEATKGPKHHLYTADQLRSYGDARAAAAVDANEGSEQWVKAGAYDMIAEAVENAGIEVNSIVEYVSGLIKNQPAAAVARHGGGGGPNIPSGLINRIEAPTGQPPRAWTAQEKIDAAEAMRRIREREAHPAAPGGVDDSVTLTELRNCCASWEPDVRVLGNVRAADAVRALDAALTAAGMGQSANPENDND